MKINEFVTEIKERTTGINDVNPFWRKIQIIGISIVGIGGLIATAPFSLPAAVVSAATYMITVGTTITSIAQLTKK